MHPRAEALARTWLSAALLLPLASALVRPFLYTSPGSPALHPSFGLVFPARAASTLRLEHQFSSENNTLEVCARWLGAGASVCARGGACRNHTADADPLYARECFDLSASTEPAPVALVLNCTRVALERVVARGGAGVRWAFAPGLVQTCPTAAPGACYTGLRARVHLASEYQVTMPQLLAGQGSRTYAPVWSFNPNHTELGYFRRTRYRAEGGISFTNNERAREDAVRENSTAGVCRRMQAATRHTVTVVAGSTPTLPREYARCPCPPGTRVAPPAACEACAPGTFAPAWNETACTDCAVGTYQPHANATGCRACDGNETTAAARSTSELNCTACLAGRHLVNTGSGLECEECPANRPVYNATSQACAECPALQAFDANLGVCAACARGQFYDASTSLCAPCAVGTYAPAGNTTACLPCPGAASGGMPGGWHVDNCTTCGVGYFRAGGVCTLCPPGTASAERDAARCECAAAGTARTYTGYMPVVARTANASVAAVHAAAPGGAHALLDITDVTLGTVSGAKRQGLRVEIVDSGGKPLLAAAVKFPATAHFLLEAFASSAGKKALVFAIYTTKIKSELLYLSLTLAPGVPAQPEQWSTTSPKLIFDQLVLAVAAARPALDVTFALLNNRSLTRFDSETGERGCVAAALTDALGHEMHTRMYARADAQVLAAAGSTSAGVWRVWLVPAVCRGAPASAARVWEGTESDTGVLDVAFVDENAGRLLAVATPQRVWLVRRGAAGWGREEIYSAESAHNAAMFAPHSGRIVTVTSAALAVYAPAKLCRACAPGTYAPTPANASDPLCRECPVGKYADAEGQTGCQACHYNYEPNTARTGCIRSGSCVIEDEAQAIAANDAEWCTCAAGLVRVNATTCRRCGAGSYAPGGNASACVSCGPGAHSTGAANTGCMPCGAGTYAEGNASTGCTACLPGFNTSSLGSSACFACDVGTYAADAGASECLPCLAGAYTNGSASTGCTACAPGFYGGGSGASACLACDVGRYAAAAAASGCTACPAGKYTNANASTACLACAPGTYTENPGLSACKGCEAGYYAMETASKGCLACAAGTHAPTGGARSCAMCPVSTYSSASAAAKCTQCPSGHNTSGPGASHVGHCVPPGGAPCDADNCTCPAGYYVLHDNENTSASCRACPNGTYLAEASQQTACRHCDAVREHSVTLAPATAHPNACVCPPGRERSGDAETCAVCAHGKFNPVHNGSCIACAGDGNTTDESGALHAHQCHCPRGFEPRTNGTAGCTQCADGAVSPGRGVPCEMCLADHFADSSVGECKQCPGELRAHPGTQGLAGCHGCPAGLGWNSKIHGCEKCGSVKVGPGKDQVCKPCAEGQVAVDNVCQACALGWTRYADDDACKRCQADTYGVHEASTDGPARAVCRPCGRNEVAPPGSSSNASCMCALGYAKYEGTCTHCPTGTRIVFPTTRGEQLQCALCDKAQCACMPGTQKRALLTGGCVPLQCAGGTLKRAEAVVRSRYLLDGHGQSNYSNLLVELLAETLGVCTEHVRFTRLELPTGTSRRMLEHEQESAPEQEYRYNATLLYHAADESIADTFSDALEQSAVFDVERPSAPPTSEPVDPPPSTGGRQKWGSSQIVALVGGVVAVVLLVAAACFFHARALSRLKGLGARPSAFDIHPEPQNALFYANVFHGAYAEAGPTCFDMAEGGTCAVCMREQCGQCSHCAQAPAAYPPVFF